MVLTDDKANLRLLKRSLNWLLEADAELMYELFSEPVDVIELPEENKFYLTHDSNIFNKHFYTVEFEAYWSHPEVDHFENMCFVFKVTDKASGTYFYFMGLIPLVDGNISVIHNRGLLPMMRSIQLAEPKEKVIIDWEPVKVGD